MYRSITIDDQREVVVDKYFVEDIWELAFGTGAYELDYTEEEVLDKLRLLLEDKDE
tara:strand:+ start:675 stop:842 length:168 start_codon:yes stop_codon:yes gene_type:complete